MDQTSRSVVLLYARHVDTDCPVQWLFAPLGDGYTIRSVLSGLYLTVEAGVSEGAVLVATPFPVSWKVSSANEGGELFVRYVGHPRKAGCIPDHQRSAGYSGPTKHSRSTSPTQLQERRSVSSVLCYIFSQAHKQLRRCNSRSTKRTRNVSCGE